ncbi:hypothetical protein [Isoptericola aurantiacus]|uniref:hypothetical protein n=1 Tax=Isoptericola aurantiacus TaxID=3377839 RepID=UPI00383AA71C
MRSATAPLRRMLGLAPRARDERSRVVLHLGSQKTGTTAIQAWCRENGELLSRHGVAARTTQEEIRTALGGWYDTSRDGADRRLREFLDATGSHRVFYSSESNVGPSFVAGAPDLYPRRRACLEGIDRATADRERTVQFTIRSYGPFLESAYLQQLKHGRAQSFAAFTADIDPAFSWVPVVQDLVDVFGAENVVLYDYDRDRTGSDPLVGQVLTDAVGALGAGQAVAGADWSHRTNSRYTQRMADLALDVLPLLRTDGERTAFHRFVSHDVADQDGEPATFLDPEQRQAHAVRYADDLAAVASLVDVR